MILTIQISVVCIAAGGCTSAQIDAAPLQASVGGRTFKVEASNAIKDQLRRNRFAPVRVEGELVQGAGGFSQGTIAISRILSAPTQRPTPKAVEIALERGGSNIPAPAFALAVAQGPPAASAVRAPTVTEKAQLQLGITPQRATMMSMTSPRGDAPPNEQRGFIHKKIGGFIGTTISTIFPPAAPVIAIGRGLLGGGGGSIAPISCAPGFRRGPDGNCIRSGVVGVFERTLPGGATGLQPIMTGSGCPSGMHPNRSSYFTQSEGFIEKGTKCVSNRRRNPLNPRAARRSMSRLTALSKEMGRLEKTLRRIAPRK